MWQASVLELLADLLECSDDVAREADEQDVPAMRAEAARKLEELAEVDMLHSMCLLVLGLIACEGLPCV